MPELPAEYVVARRVLLDALEALGPHRSAAVVIGAQALYLRTGDAGIRGVAPYTTDADVALDPALLADEPLLEALMSAGGFRATDEPGIWLTTVEVDAVPVDVEVDLMVPAGNAPTGGRRAARLPPHGRRVARKTSGLEGVLLDHDVLRVSAFDPADGRRFLVRVAGPAALLVAKVFKLRDRLEGGRDDRLADKDASDVYRLMLDVSVGKVVARMRPLLADGVAGPVASEGLERLAEYFGAPRAVGVRMATDALAVAVPPERVAAVCVGFVRELRTALGPSADG